MIECPECGKLQLESELKHEYDFEYDQKSCSCGNVLIDCIHGHEYFERKANNLGYWCKHIKNIGVMFGDEWECTLGLKCECPDIESCEKFKLSE